MSKQSKGSQSSIKTCTIKVPTRNRCLWQRVARSPLNFVAATSYRTRAGLSGFRSISRKSWKVRPCSAIWSSSISRIKLGKNAPQRRSATPDRRVVPIRHRKLRCRLLHTRLTRFTAAQSTFVTPEGSTTFNFCPMVVGCPPLTADETIGGVPRYIPMEVRGGVRRPTMRPESSVCSPSGNCAIGFLTLIPVLGRS